MSASPGLGGVQATPAGPQHLWSKSWSCVQMRTEATLPCIHGITLLVTLGWGLAFLPLRVAQPWLPSSFPDVPQPCLEDPKTTDWEGMVVFEVYVCWKG